MAWAEEAEPPATADVRESAPSLVVVRTRGPAPDRARHGSGFVRNPGIVVATFRAVRAADEIQLLYASGAVEDLPTQVLAIDYEHGLVLLGADTPAHGAPALGLQMEIPAAGSTLVLAGRVADDGVHQRNVTIASAPTIAGLGPAILLTEPVEARDEGAVLLAPGGRVAGILRVHEVDGSVFGYGVPASVIELLSPDSLWAPPPFPEDAQKRRAETERLRGLRALLQTDAEAALPPLRASIEADPKHLLAASTWWQIGSCYEALEQGEAAVEAYENAERLYRTTGAFDEPYGIRKELGVWKALARVAPQRVDVHRALAELHHELGDDASVLAALQALSRLESADAQVFFDLGMTFLRLGRAQEAVAPLHRAAALDDDFFEAHLQLGLLHETRKDAAKAAKAYADAVRADPSSVVGLRGLGWAHATMEAWDEARSAFERALALEPASAHTAYNLALCYHELGMRTELASILTKLDALDAAAATELRATIAEANRPPAQVYEVGPRFPTERIREYWQKRYHITSMAYGDAEWAVILSYSTDPWQPQRYRSDRKIPREDWNQLRASGYALTGFAGRADKWISTWTRRPDVKSQSLMVTPSFPEKDIRTRLARGLRVTGLAHRPGWWGVVMSFPSAYGDQILIRSAEVQEATVKSWWDRGYRITAVAHGDQSWVLVLSKDSGLKEQTWVLSESFPEDEIRALWADGYQVTGLARGDGQWLVVLSMS